jgi:hypothetical protein
MGQNSKQVFSDFAISAPQPPAVALFRCRYHHPVQVVLQPSSVSPARYLCQIARPPCQHHGTQQQRLHTGRENGVAGVDRVLAVAQLMGVMPTSA